MTKPLAVGGILCGILMPPTTGPRATAAPEVNKPTLVPGRAGFGEEAAATQGTPKATRSNGIKPDAEFRTVKKSAYTPTPLKKDSNMSYASIVSDALAAAGGRLSREALSTAIGLTGKKLENAMTRARMAGLAYRDGGDVVAGTQPAKGSAPKKPRAKPTKRVAKPATVLAKAEVAKAVAKPNKRPVRFVPCGPGATSALDKMIADSTRAIITADRGAIILVGDRMEQEITPAAMAALAKATAEVRV